MGQKCCLQVTDSYNAVLFVMGVTQCAVTDCRTVLHGITCVPVATYGQQAILTALQLPRMRTSASSLHNGSNIKIQSGYAAASSLWKTHML